MSQISALLRDWVGAGQKGLRFWCPGCNTSHSIRTEPNGWGYNGNADAPTFTPSVLVQYNGPDAGQDRGDGDRAPPAVCHSFVTDGKIQFLGDCTHALVGQTVPLPAWPEGWA